MVSVTTTSSVAVQGGIAATPRKLNSTVIVVSGSGSLAVHWESRLGCDVYYVHNTQLLTNVIQRLAHKHIDPTVVVVYEELRFFLAVCKTLYSLNETRRNEFHQSFLEAKRLFQGVSELHTTQTVAGECDSAIAFKTVVVIPSQTLTSDVLSNQSITAQLFARVLALKHGASVVSHSGNIKWVIDAIAAKELATMLPKPVAEDTHNLVLWIPKAWDSWSKISILAKVSLVHGAIPQLSGDMEYAQFLATYNQYLVDDTIWLQLEATLSNHEDRAKIDKYQRRPPQTLAEYLQQAKQSV